MGRKRSWKNEMGKIQDKRSDKLEKNWLRERDKDVLLYRKTATWKDRLIGKEWCDGFSFFSSCFHTLLRRIVLLEIINVIACDRTYKISHYRPTLVNKGKTQLFDVRYTNKNNTKLITPISFLVCSHLMEENFLISTEYKY